MAKKSCLALYYYYGTNVNVSEGRGILNVCAYIIVNLFTSKEVLYYITDIYYSTGFKLGKCM